MEPTELEGFVADLEQRVERLRVLYEQYFMGIEKLEPAIVRKDVDRRLWELRREQIRNTAIRFKLQTIVQRYNTYQQHWMRICREIENGTYKRDLRRAVQRFGSEQFLTAATRKRLGKRGLEPTEGEADMDFEVDLDFDEGVPSERRPSRISHVDEGAALHNVSVAQQETTGGATVEATNAAIADRNAALPAPSEDDTERFARLPFAPGSPKDAPSPQQLQAYSPVGSSSAARVVAESGQHRPYVPLQPGPHVPAHHAPTRQATMPGFPSPNSPVRREPPVPEDGSAAQGPLGTSRTLTGMPQMRLGTAAKIPAVPPQGAPPKTGGAAEPPPQRRDASSGEPQRGPVGSTERGATSPSTVRSETPRAVPRTSSGEYIPVKERILAQASASLAASRDGKGPSSPQSAAPQPAGDSLTDTRCRQIYQRYVEAKRQCKEQTAGITEESLAATLKNSAAKLAQQHRGKRVDFDVVIKDGKAILKPIIKG